MALQKLCAEQLGTNKKMPQTLGDKMKMDKAKPKKTKGLEGQTLAAKAASFLASLFWSKAKANKMTWALKGRCKICADVATQYNAVSKPDMQIRLESKMEGNFLSTSDKKDKKDKAPAQGKEKVISQGKKNKDQVIITHHPMTNTEGTLLKYKEQFLNGIITKTEYTKLLDGICAGHGIEFNKIIKEGTQKGFTEGLYPEVGKRSLEHATKVVESQLDHSNKIYMWNESVDMKNPKLKKWLQETLAVDRHALLGGKKTLGDLQANYHHRHNGFLFQPAKFTKLAEYLKQDAKDSRIGGSTTYQISLRCPDGSGHRVAFAAFSQKVGGKVERKLVFMDPNYGTFTVPAKHAEHLTKFAQHLLIKKYSGPSSKFKFWTCQPPTFEYRAMTFYSKSASLPGVH